MTSNSLIEEAFIEHEIVPDAISKPPREILNIVYDGGHRVGLGATLTPRQVKDQPVVSWNAENGALYTLAMIDPDAPSRKDLERKEIEHWLIINIPGKEIEKGETLSSYFGAGPSPNTGLHRYIFLIFKQPTRLSDSSRGGTTYEEMSKNRRRYIKEFIEKHRLGAPVAGNFFQAEYDDYVGEMYRKMGRG